MRCRFLLVMVLFVVFLSGCDDLNEFFKEADQRFGDQNFKTCIALVELHKVRFGEYPESLTDLKYVGDWDENALASARYSKSGEGYTLEVSQGFVGKPELMYPQEFWQGLGIIRQQ